MPFGQHKGYGLALIDEVIAGVHRRIASHAPRPAARRAGGRKANAGVFLPVHAPDAIGCDFALGRSQGENLKAVLKDIVGHGNDNVLFPGEPEARAAA